MNTTNFLEQVAKEAYYSRQVKELISTQPEKTQEALETNNPSIIHSHFHDTNYLANGITVVEI